MDVNDRMLTYFPLAPRRLGEAQRHEVALWENGAVLIEMRQGQDFAIAEEVASVNRRAAVEAIGLCIVVAPVEAEHWRATCGIGQAKRTAQGGHEYVRIRERSLFLIDKEEVQGCCVARLLRRLLHQPLRVPSARRVIRILRNTRVSDVRTPPVHNVDGGLANIAEAIDRPNGTVVLGGVHIYGRHERIENVRQDFPALVGLLWIRERGSAVIVVHHIVPIRQNLDRSLPAVFLSRLYPGRRQKVMDSGTNV